VNESRTFEILDNATSRQAIYRCVQAAPVGYLVKVSPATRSLVQSAKLHAMFADVAKGSEYMGRKLTATQWKTLMISGHAIATGLGADMVPGLEGEFVSIRESSAQMSVARMSSLIEYVSAWMAEQGVAA
jgi:hypothetical protein